MHKVPHGTCYWPWRSKLAICKWDLAPAEWGADYATVVIHINSWIGVSRRVWSGLIYDCQGVRNFAFRSVSKYVVKFLF